MTSLIAKNAAKLSVGATLGQASKYVGKQVTKAAATAISPNFKFAAAKALQAFTTTPRRGHQSILDKSPPSPSPLGAALSAFSESYLDSVINNLENSSVAPKLQNNHSVENKAPSPLKTTGNKENSSLKSKNSIFNIPKTYKDLKKAYSYFQEIRK